MSGKKGMKNYPKATKLEAVRMFLEEGLTRAEVVEALGLPRRDLHDPVHSYSHPVMNVLGHDVQTAS